MGNGSHACRAHFWPRHGSVNMQKPTLLTLNVVIPVSGPWGIPTIEWCDSCQNIVPELELVV